MTLERTVQNFLDGYADKSQLVDALAERLDTNGVLTMHKAHTRPTNPDERPALPRLQPEDFVKAKYSHGNQRCYTARMLDVFLPEEGPHFVAAYREFRLATMDYLYENHRDDHAATAEARCKCWNTVGEQLGYFSEDHSQ